MKALFLSLAIALTSGALAAPSLPSNHLPLPIVRQSTDYSCGAASLLSVLQYWGVYEDTESALFEPLKTTPENGTPNEEIVRLARKLGLTARASEGNTLADLEAALQTQETVILNLQAWREKSTLPWKDTWEEGHYAVLVGMDKEYLYVMDPVVGTSYTYLPKAEFLDRWHDYEISEGTVRRYFQLALFIKGKKALPHFPAALVRID